MILQDRQTSLNPVFTIGNQVIEALRVHRRGAFRDLWQRAEQALERVKVAAAAQRMRAFPHQISGGTKQRVVGAIAVGAEPRVLIADEPTTALDATIQLQYLQLLKEIQTRTRLAMLFITHDFGIVARMCDRVAVMYAGRIVEEGPMRDLFRSPRHPQHGSPPRLGAAHGGADGAAPLHRGSAPAAPPPARRVSLRAALPLHRGPLPRGVSAGLPGRAESRSLLLEIGAPVSDALLQVDSLTKHFPVTQGLLFARTTGQVKAVDGVSFGIGRQETLGLVGESGCGKTTTARLLLRLERPTSGHMRLDGRDIQTLAGVEPLLKPVTPGHLVACHLC